MMKKEDKRTQGQKRSLVTIILSLTLVAALLVGTSLAFLTDRGEASVAVETAVVGLAFDAANEDVAEAMPGTIIALEPQVRLTEESQDAFVRVRVELTDEAGPISRERATTIFEAIALTNEDWDFNIVQGEGGTEMIFTRENAMTNQNLVEMPFENLAIPGNANNRVLAEFNNVTITMTAEAVQSAGFENATDAFGAVNGNIISIVG